MPSEKAMRFWGFFHDDDDNGGVSAPDMEEFPYIAAGSGVLTSLPPPAPVSQAAPPLSASWVFSFHAVL
jgi:hypothetical protein